MARNELRKVQRHLRCRRFGFAMQAALCDLARDLEVSFRSVTAGRTVDLGDLHRAAQSVPGLLDWRRTQRNRPDRMAA